MASDLPPPPPAAPTTICALDDDLLREIFLRLPSLPTLVRAALTCRSSLRAVRSSPAFRRRFRELHCPPLLGIFLSIFHADTPDFRPLRLSSDPDLTAAVRGTDFFLTGLPAADDEGSAFEWVIRDCHDGYVLLISSNDTDRLAVYNPLTRALHLFPKPPADICEDLHVEFHVHSTKEDRGSFRVICVCHESFGAQAAVLSSETREWQVFPWVDAESMQPALHPGDDEQRHRYHDGTLANGSIYWTQASEDSARVLNTATFHFSRIDLPTHIEWQGAFTAGETKDGKLCMAKAVRLTLLLWLRGADGDGVEGWMLDKTFPLEQTINELMHYFSCHYVSLKVLAIRDGVVYLCSYREVDSKLSGWFLSFCLETAKLEKLCPILDADDMYPYIMVWPPSLVLNKIIHPLQLGCWDLRTDKYIVAMLAQQSLERDPDFDQ